MRNASRLVGIGEERLALGRREARMQEQCGHAQFEERQQRDHRRDLGGRDQRIRAAVDTRIEGAEFRVDPRRELGERVRMPVAAERDRIAGLDGRGADGE